MDGHVGKDLGEIAGLGRPLGVKITGDAGAALRTRKPDVVVLGTGVNPGFTMDALPITLTAVCEDVKAIRVDRVQDARVRRLPFQQKIGAGLTPEQFQAKVAAGTVRHVGLTESISMIADALGFRLDRITDEIRPQVAEQDVATASITVDSIPRVLAAPPGLHTMRSLPIPSWFGGK